MGNIAALVATAACYLFVFQSHGGCAAREPILFTALTVLGSTVASRAWQISVLFAPVAELGRTASTLSDIPSALQKDLGLVERMRKFLLRSIRGATGRRSMRQGGPNRIQVKISTSRTLGAVALMVLPQVLLQTLIVAIPTTRSKLQSYTLYENNGVHIGRMQCQSDLGQEWQLAFSILFTCIPFVVAWILNQRPKSELEKLPAAEMVDERKDLNKSFWIFIRALITASPLIGMSLSPNAHAYAAICLVLSIPLSMCYHLSYIKLISISNNSMLEHTFGHDNDGKGSVASAVRMAEMYLKIGRNQESFQCCEETLNLWRKSGGQNAIGLAGRENNEEVGSGFTKSDLAGLSSEELQLIIKLLKIKGKTLITVYGHEKGPAMISQLHVDILKIFEECPASAKVRDTPIMFPVYNYIGLQIKGGAFDQDYVGSLEVELAQKFQYEAQVQAYHLARALANLADVYGRMGHCEEAFRYYEIMQSIYMKEQ